MRISKVILMLSVAIFSSLVVFNNVTDYDSNFQFVRHVMMMDTTFPGNKGLWRSISNPLYHHAFYLLIISAEGCVALLAWVGTLQLWRASGDAAVFNHRKDAAILALTLGIVLWFTGFIAIGGEWFLMWQSKVWNGQQAAFRISTYFALVLLFITRDDKDADEKLTLP